MEYSKMIENGSLKLLCEEDGNWNIYIDDKLTTWYIAKDNTCHSGMYCPSSSNSIKHFLNCIVNHNNSIVKINDAFKSLLENKLKMYATKKEIEKYNAIVQYIN
jgi:hypothetical protein